MAEPTRGRLDTSVVIDVEWRRPAPAAPRHSRPPLPLLPSGPDGVHDLAMRGDRCEPPSTEHFTAKGGEDIMGPAAAPKPEFGTSVAGPAPPGSANARGVRTFRPPEIAVVSRRDDFGGCAGRQIADSRRLTYPLQPPERCPSGLRSTPGKCVYVNSVPRVRIPPSPPFMRTALPHECLVIAADEVRGHAPGHELGMLHASGEVR